MQQSSCKTDRGRRQVSLQFNCPYWRAPKDVSFSWFILCAVIRNVIQFTLSMTGLLSCKLRLTEAWPSLGQNKCELGVRWNFWKGWTAAEEMTFPAVSCHLCFLSFLFPPVGMSKISSCDCTLGHKVPALPSYSVSPVPGEWKEGQVATAIFINLWL